VNTSRDQVRRNLTQTVIGRPLIDKIEASKNPDAFYDVIIDPNLDFSGGRDRARDRIRALIGSPAMRVDSAHPYIFATLTGREIREIVAHDSTNDSAHSDGPDSTPALPSGKQRLNSGARAIYRIWEDTEVEALLTNSVATVKADAAQAAFAADGKDIVWAVVDSGIDRRHQHFTQYCNLTLPLPLEHKDFTPGRSSPLTDEYGHGTHVAGIIAGRMDESTAPQAILQTRDDEGNESEYVRQPLGRTIRGVAPQCRLLSLKVLNASGRGKASAVIEAIAAIQKLNDFGRRIIVHGVNLSLGYPFMPEWFACGQSPLCTEVNRLVKSGVVVVAAAGNSGYGSIDAQSGSVTAAGLPLTINDPGNAEHAITVGSTHRDMPHTYGVSYFSSKGPTGDGRLKPDLVAPGERILSCAAGKTQPDATFHYVEDSGTSMAAPHVSGAIAAFLSIRREYIGQPEAVKKIFMENATDLKRDRTFQGSGLLDLMRAIQSI
jgi:subtilisin family serine protease